MTDDTGTQAHDPLCQTVLCETVECSDRCDTNPCYCTCNYIAKVRADEVRKAALIAAMAADALRAKS